MKSDKIVLGLAGHYYHDASAAIMKGGKLLGVIEEERLVRIKRNRDSRSCKESINYLLSKCGLDFADIDIIAFSSDVFEEKNSASQRDEVIKEIIGRDDVGFDFDKIMILKHHLCHAASSYFPSGFKSANLIVIDGSGDGISSSIHLAENNSINLSSINQKRHN